ncbi:hypothetical protein TIFTF001_009325 [Ficus carica]|uniref:Uncharacterized protein n=1 Tax=Ficus carica TaxID=3494 RepID=A0AA87ZTM8_FICCA|nr:hypothetical protein TIFTF001_009325 [Ficus carica]
MGFPTSSSNARFANSDLNTDDAKEKSQNSSNSSSSCRNDDDSTTKIISLKKKNNSTNDNNNYRTSIIVRRQGSNTTMNQLQFKYGPIKKQKSVEVLLPAPAPAPAVKARKRIITNGAKEERVRRTRSEDISNVGITKQVFRNKVRRYKLLDEVSFKLNS